jgi:hypothetical protein
MRVLFIDNLDSFTFNLVHCMLVAGVDVEVLRNEGEDWPELAEKMADCDAWAGGGRGGSTTEHPPPHQRCFICSTPPPPPKTTPI